MTPSDIEKSRKEFEKYCKDKPDFLLKDKDGKYINNDCYMLFIGWIARQDSQVVGLPYRKIHEKNDSSVMKNLKSGFNLAIDEMKNTCESAGINYRERE